MLNEAKPIRNFWAEQLVSRALPKLPNARGEAEEPQRAKIKKRVLKTI